MEKNNFQNLLFKKNSLFKNNTLQFFKIFLNFFQNSQLLLFLFNNNTYPKIVIKFFHINYLWSLEISLKWYFNLYFILIESYSLKFLILNIDYFTEKKTNALSNPKIDSQMEKSRRRRKSKLTYDQSSHVLRIKSKSSPTREPTPRLFNLVRACRIPARVCICVRRYDTHPYTGDKRKWMH